MTLFQYSLLFFGLYVAVLAFITWKAQVMGKGAGYVIGHRGVGTFGMAASMVGILRSGSALLFWFYFTAMFGLTAGIVIIAYYIVLIFLAFIAPRVRRMAADHDFVTLTDFLAFKIGPHTARMTTTLSLWIAIILIAGQIYVTGVVLGGLLSVGHTSGMFIGCGVVAAYVALGGFISIVRTDMFQAGLIVILALATYCLADWPEWQQVKADFKKTDMSTFIGFSLSALTILPIADLWQRIFSAQSDRAVRNGILIGVGADMLVVVGMVLFIYNMIMMVPGTDPSILFETLFAGGHGDPMVIALFGIFVLSAMMSTVDNSLYVVGSTITKNILKIDAQSQRRRYILISRILTVATLGLLALLSLYVEDMLKFMIDTFMLVGMFAPLIMIAIFIDRANPSIDRMIVGGFAILLIIYSVMFIRGDFADMKMFIIPYGLSAIAGGAIWLAHNRDRRRN